MYSYEAKKRSSDMGALKAYSTQTNHKRKGEGRRKRTCDQQCKVCLTDGAMIVTVAHACKPQYTVTRMAGKVFVFARKKKRKSSLAQNGVMSSWGVFSLLSFSPPPPPPPTLSLSLPIFLSLSQSLSLSLCLSLSRGTHTLKHRRLNALPYDGPTDFASNCIHLVE